MAINYKCDMCGKEITNGDQSSLAVETKDFSIYKKYDLCLSCAETLEKVLKLKTQTAGDQKKDWLGASPGHLRLDFE